MPSVFEQCGKTWQTPSDVIDCASLYPTSLSLSFTLSLCLSPSLSFTHVCHLAECENALSACVVSAGTFSRKSFPPSIRDDPYTHTKTLHCMSTCISNETINRVPRPLRHVSHQKKLITPAQQREAWHATSRSSCKLGT